MINFFEACKFLGNTNIPNDYEKIQHQLEDEIIFSIALNKDQIYREKVSYFEQHVIKKIYVFVNKTNLGNLSKTINGVDILSVNYFDLKDNCPQLVTKFKDSIVIMTNNIFAEIGAYELCELYEKTPNTIYVVHDYDNHHWVNNSAQAALFSDIYIPAHQGDFTLQGRLNSNIIGGIPCGSNQWRIDFILDKNMFQNLERSSEPLGKYYYYEKFTHRNKVISTLNKHYSSINIQSNDFHNLSEEDKWSEWSKHKLHWVIPVLNDLPIRFFDALISGGLPLIPASLKPYVHLLGIPEDFYSSYTPMDILEPKKFIDDQIKKYERLGVQGQISRSFYTVENFHIDSIVRKIIFSALELYRTNLSS